MAVTCLPSTPQRLRTCLFALNIIVSSRRHLHSPPMYRLPKTNNSRTSRVNWPKWEANDRNHNKSTAKCDIALPTDEGRQVQSAKTPKELCSTANRAAIVIRQINVDHVRCNIGGTDAERGLSFAGSVSPSPFIAVENFSSGPTRAWLASGAREGITAVSPEFLALDHDEPTRRGTNERTTLNERGQSSSSYEPRNKEEPSLLQ